jgi:hypothetical protein
MFALVLGALAVMPVHAPAGRAAHEPRNALLDALLDPGLAIGPGLRAKFPPPTMPDRLGAAEQKAVIAALIRDEYPYEDFTRRSAVTPQRLRMRDITPSDPDAPARGVDVWFVAYDDTFVGWLASAAKGVGRGQRLTKEQLGKRGIRCADGTPEVYKHVAFDFLEKVQLRGTVRVVWTRTDESVLIAAEIDPRFVGDPEFPNQWQPVVREGGARKLGPAKPWGGAGFYMKITKLAEPAGAVFVEQHLIFAEPTGWFDGANLLRSKLPLVVQSSVRTTRREWAKAGGR